VRANLAFTCTHEADHLPALDPNAEKLFRYARFLQKQEGPKDFDNIVRYYRIAAAHGHYKTNGNAQLLIRQGLVVSPEGPKEAVDWIFADPVNMLSDKLYPRLDLAASLRVYSDDECDCKIGGSRIHILPTHFEGSSIERRGRRQFALQFFESGAQHCP
jgi:hypothetical protein